MEYKEHTPVMLEEVLHYLAPKDGETYVDGTFGAGGYTRGILSSCKCNVISIDRDPSVDENVSKIKSEFPDSFRFIRGNFGDIKDLLNDQQVDGMILDIGVSSMQIDQAERGFSFMQEGPLDMRMSKSGVSAEDFINSAEEKEIADIIYNYGGERRSRVVAKAILNARSEKRIQTTSQLASIVRSVVRRAKDNIDPATRTFQAIRIHVNDELGELERALKGAKTSLKEGGRLIVVTFHSLEDSIVKKFLKNNIGKEKSVSRHMPLIKEENDSKKIFEIITKKPVTASNEEININIRSRSAKLRAAIRTSENEIRGLND